MKKALGKSRFGYLAAVLLACLLFCGRADSDFGNFAGNSDYDRGGSSGGYGGGYNGGYSGGYTGGRGRDYDMGGSYSYYLSDSLDSGPVEIWIAAVILFILYQAFASLKKSRAPAGPAAPVSAAARRDLRPMSGLLEADPQFDEAALKERLANLYVQMQDCWHNKDIESLRPCMTDAFYSQMERQLDAFRKQRRTDYTERIAVLGVEPLGWRQDGGMDCLTVRLETRITTYILDDRTGRVVSGSRDREKFMEYEWDLVRKAGARTRKVGGVRAEACPHCGAPLSINASARCEYCGSVVTAPGDSWALSAIRGVSQRTV